MEFLSRAPQLQIMAIPQQWMGENPESRTEPGKMLKENPGNPLTTLSNPVPMLLPFQRESGLRARLHLPLNRVDRASALRRARHGRRRRALQGDASALRRGQSQLPSHQRVDRVRGGLYQTGIICETGWENLSWLLAEDRAGTA